MRAEKTSEKGLTVKGIAGTYVVLLAFNCNKTYCKGLLGFGVLRTDHENGETVWLRGLKKFDLPGDDGEDVSTRHHPIQKFHWGDYTTKPGRAYTYSVHAFKGTKDSLTIFEKVDVKVTCENPESVGSGEHAVHFNRSAAASHAFAARFPSLPKGEVEDPAAQTWLSRGLAESLIQFIDDTKADEGLHLFVYEFEKESYFEALQRALKRGVDLQILHDGIIKTKKSKDGDEDDSGPTIKADPLIKKFGLTKVTQKRTGAGLNISHNKFMVRTKKGKASAVWTGSTNFTDSGVFGQSNVGHAVKDESLATQYFKWHQAIWEAPDTSAKDSRTIVEELTTVPGKSPKGTTLVLSPRTSIAAVTECAALVSAAKRMVCFTAPFALHDDLETALAGAPAQVFGLLNKDSVVGEDLHKAPNTQLAAAAALNDKSVLEAWQGALLAESMHHSGVYIHTKIVLIDPLGENPIVITGSANFSNNSSKNNDENQLFIAGEPAVADVYLGEFMRMFDHYYFRSHIKELKKNKKSAFLVESDSWTSEYFKGSKEANRLAFFK